jgi:hypothetical protein
MVLSKVTIACPEILSFLLPSRSDVICHCQDAVLISSSFGFQLGRCGGNPLTPTRTLSILYASMCIAIYIFLKTAEYFLEISECRGEDWCYCQAHKCDASTRFTRLEHVLQQRSKLNECHMPNRNSIIRLTVSVSVNAQQSR